MSSEESAEAVCQHPECDDEATETFVGAHGNELALCEEDYFEAVYPPTRVRSVVRSRKGDEGDSGGSLLGMFK